MGKRRKKVPQLPRSVSRRLLARAARGDKTAVVVFKNGAPTSVWGLAEYLDRRELASSVKPWEKRAPAVTSPPDPLGAIEGSPACPLTRNRFYEE